MDYETQNRKGKFAIWSGVGWLLVGFFMLALASGEKESLEYYWSSSHRSNVDMVTMLGVLAIVAGAAELIYGIVLRSAADGAQSVSAAPATNSNAGNVPELIEGEVIKKELDTENLIEWVTFRQKNGNMIRVYHELSDHVTYNAGDRGIVRTKDQKIVKYIPDENH